MPHIILIILLSGSGTTPVTTTQVLVEDKASCEHYSGELRALFHKANIKAITTCIKSGQR